MLVSRLVHAADRDPERVYTEHFGTLVEVALSGRATVDDAEEIAHEVLLSSLRHPAGIENVETWLIAAVKCAMSRRTAGA